jgi:hypothetical protein
MLCLLLKEDNIDGNHFSLEFKILCQNAELNQDEIRCRLIISMHNITGKLKPQYIDLPLSACRKTNIAIFQN